MRKRTREEIATAQELINKWTIVIERAVLESDIKVAPFEFIYQRFQENKWLSLFDSAGNIFPRLVREFYKNMKVERIHPETPCFVTKVRGTKIIINTALIISVTSIPVSPGPGTSFPYTAYQPSREALMECLNPQGGLVWDEEGKNNVPIGWVHSPQRLLAKIVMQNIWPIARHSVVPFSRARLIYAIIN